MALVVLDGLRFIKDDTMPFDRMQYSFVLGVELLPPGIFLRCSNEFGRDGRFWIRPHDLDIKGRKD